MARSHIVRRILGQSCLSFQILLFIALRRIMSATVRENILFSHTYDPEFYETVLDGRLQCIMLRSCAK